MIWWTDGCPEFLDQTQLPVRRVVMRAETIEQMAEAIEQLRVRGAPLIGVSAAYGMALSARLHENDADFLQGIKSDAKRLRDTRPTAVNLFWALDRVVKEIEHVFSESGAHGAVDAALALAEQMKREDIETNRLIGQNGRVLFESGDGILTHCNAGALATAGYGTALGVVRAVWGQGKKIHVYADETRPLLQGARLTCWELMQDNIPVTLCADSMAAVLMRGGKIQKVIVGADRIAKNGDTANKIGTYGVAVLAKAHGIPFYVAAPESTIDRTLECGKQIPIEMRNADEMRAFQGMQSAPRTADVFNPAFDVTPAGLIDAIITQRQVYLRESFPDFKL